MKFNFGPQWYVVVTRSQKEFTCERVLKSFKFDCFVPTRMEYRRPNRYARAKRGVFYPLMPSYVFVRLDLRKGDDLISLDSTGYVRGFLAKDGRPWSIAEKDRKDAKGKVIEVGVESLRGRSFSAPEAHRFMRTHREFKVGEIVRISEGALAELQHIVREINLENKTALVETDFLGAKRTVEAPLDQLIKAA